MHIAYLCDEYPPASVGGVGAFVQTLGRALVSRGHRVTVVGCHAGADAEEMDRGVHVIRLRRTRLPRLGTWRNGRRITERLRRLHDQAPIDLLEAPGSGLALVSPSLPVVKVIRMHGGHRFFAEALGKRPRPFRALAERHSTSRADRFCAVSRYVAEQNRRLLGLGDVAIPVIPNPVDPRVFVPRPQERVIGGRVLFLGTLAPKKGVRELMQAAPRFLDAVAHAHLVVAGRDWKDPGASSGMRQTLESMVPDRLRDRVRFLGEVPHAQVPDALAAAEVVVYPSLMEAMPVAWIEAMSMGKAIVASTLGPGPEVIESGSDGLLVDPRDPVALGDAVTRLLLDPALRAALGARARDRVLQNYAVDVLVARNEAFYQDAITPASREAVRGCGAPVAPQV